MRDVQCSFINDLVPNKLDNWNNEYKRRRKFIELLKFKYERKAFNNLNWTLIQLLDSPLYGVNIYLVAVFANQAIPARGMSICMCHIYRLCHRKNNLF